LAFSVAIELLVRGGGGGKMGYSNRVEAVMASLFFYFGPWPLITKRALALCALMACGPLLKTLALLFAWAFCLREAKERREEAIFFISLYFNFFFAYLQLSSLYKGSNRVFFLFSLSS